MKKKLLKRGKRVAILLFLTYQNQFPFFFCLLIKEFEEKVATGDDCRSPHARPSPGYEIKKGIKWSLLEEIYKFDIKKRENTAERCRDNNFSSKWTCWSRSKVDGPGGDRANVFIPDLRDYIRQVIHFFPRPCEEISIWRTVSDGRYRKSNVSCRDRRRTSFSSRAITVAWGDENTPIANF